MIRVLVLPDGSATLILRLTLARSRTGNRVTAIVIRGGQIVMVVDVAVLRVMRFAISV
jgi:hypothetical protein